VIEIGGVSSCLSLIAVGSSINASLTPLSGVVVEVCHSGAGPAALVATHPAGKAGAVTPSKFSEFVAIRTPVGMVKETVPRSFPPSDNESVAVIFVPHARAGSAVKVNV
jgi:hypothetical protein